MGKQLARVSSSSSPSSRSFFRVRGKRGSSSWLYGWREAELEIEKEGCAGLRARAWLLKGSISRWDYACCVGPRGYIIRCELTGTSKRIMDFFFFIEEGGKGSVVISCRFIKL